MSNHLREDKECQNCGRTVEEIYCPNCGQKNTETRQYFGHLVAHFAEDLTHYDSGFWRTVKYLMFRPARLTQEYLMGKRQSYVPPVKLYIFISFITFFIPAILPGPSKEKEALSADETQQAAPMRIVSLEEKMTTEASVWVTALRIHGNEVSFDNPLYYSSLEEMDSIEKAKPQHLRLSPFNYKMGARVLALYTKKTPEEIGEQFLKSFYNYIPKTLFIYLPIFAFWLWLFHSKKRWLFFDHGIFTLHYFSFLLLNITMLVILYKIARAIDTTAADIIYMVLFLFSLVWQVYYFFRAHRKMYHESWIINFIKSIALFAINIFCIVFIALILTYITFYNLH